MEYVMAIVAYPIAWREWAKEKSKPFLLCFPRWITPNLISYFRILLTAPICYFLFIDQVFVLAFCLYVIACITDFLDGALAEVKNMKTAWGKILDPIADKILKGTIFTFLIYTVFSQWAVFQVVLWANIGTDVITAVSALAVSCWKKDFAGANKYGKVKFGCQCAGVFSVMFQCVTLAFIALSLSAILGVCSAIKHLRNLS
ncbi:MAG TPA: CDP-alcohol phosphatidyltransferase family protein [Candidatus Moranbacteria bacterium]|nr:CDP-alcohol phosphatidyltransferase family protein [Candidatus Moranbacteria bacterium]